VDRGTNLGFTTDLKGNAVFSGTAPDAGALESGSTASTGSSSDSTGSNIDTSANSSLQRIEAESYSAMSGVEVSATTDGGGGKFVGWIDDNDWMDYNVTVPAAGTYKLNVRVSSAIPGGGPLQLRNASGTVLATVNTPNTGGWDTYTTVSTTVTLPAGQQTLRIYASNGGWNINWFELL
jgi:hypothetical protein